MVIMRLLIATGLYPPDIGGPATYTRFLEEHLPKRGIELVVVSFSEVRKYSKGIRHIVYLFRLVKQGRTSDVIYALDTISVGVPACIASVLLRKKLYLRVPGDYAWEQGQQRWGITETLDAYLLNPKKPFFVRILAWLQYRVALHASKIIVPSEYMRGVVVAWGIDAKKITRIYSALNPVHIDASRDLLREKYQYKDFVVVTSARLVPWKGIDVLMCGCANVLICAVTLSGVEVSAYASILSAPAQNAQHDE